MKLLQTNRNIKEIDLSDNSISPRVIEEINNKLIENAKNKEQAPNSEFKPLDAKETAPPAKTLKTK